MKRAAILACVAAVVAAASSLAIVTLRIDRFAKVDEARPADVIVVLGAAEYRGHPSPVLKARLDHALALYRARIAPRILTTGGAGGDPLFTEGEVGRDYLVRQRVPSEAILVEEEAESTADSLAAAGEIMRRMNLRSCVVVTDGYHAFRCKRMLEQRGFVVYSSPRPPGRMEESRYWRLCARQALGYLLWRAGVVI